MSCHTPRDEHHVSQLKHNSLELSESYHAADAERVDELFSDKGKCGSQKDVGDSQVPSP